MKPLSPFTNPQTRADKAIMICWWAGILVAFGNMLPFKSGTDTDKMVQSLILMFTSFALFAPMAIISHRRFKKSSREMAHELRRLETELIVHETILKIFDPEGYKKAKAEMEARHAVAKMFNSKAGPKEK